MRAYKYRVYPTPVQEAILSRCFGHARWVWNTALAIKQKAYWQGGQRLSSAELSRRLTRWKNSVCFGWLGEVPDTILRQKLRDLDDAYQRYFSGQAQRPRFKKRTHEQAIRFQLDQRKVSAMFDAGRLLKLPRLGLIKVNWNRPGLRLPTGVPKMVTLRKDACGDYWVTFMCEETIIARPRAAGTVGVDVGIKSLAVLSSGHNVGALSPLKASLKRLRRASRAQSRRKKGSQRWHAQRLKIARLHRRAARQRQDLCHQLSSRLIDENQVICLEDLNVTGMLKNGKLSRAIADAAWGELKRQVVYKAQWHGRTVVQIDRFAASSKTCHVCDEVNADLTLRDREWVCSGCGTHHDRDLNAARNIARWGQTLLDGTAGTVGTGRVLVLNGNLLKARGEPHHRTSCSGPRRNASKRDQASRPSQPEGCSGRAA